MINRFRNSLRAKTILSLMAILAPIVFVSFATNYILSSMSSNYQDIGEELKLELQPVKKVRVPLPQVVTTIDAFFATGNRQYFNDYTTLEKTIDARFDDINLSNFSLGTERKSILSAEKDWREIKSIAALIIGDPGAKDNPEAFKKMVQMDELVLSADNKLEQAGDHAEQEIQENLELTARDRTRNIFLVGIIMVFSVGVVIVAGVYLLRSILRPVRELENGVQQVQEGDLKHRIKVFKNDELGQVSQAFNEMTEELAVYSERLTEIATHDDLTSLYNHREFYNQLENEADLAKRYGLFFSLAMFDIDFFKKVNDKYGHKAGDVVLAAVAGTIKQTARSHDICARYGGEEFAVILPQTHKEDGVIIAKRICAQIASNPIVLDDPDNPVKLTISAGVAEFERNAKDIEGLFNKADSALYNAKETGRNRVVVYREAA